MCEEPGGAAHWLLSLLWSVGGRDGGGLSFGSIVHFSCGSDRQRVFNPRCSMDGNAPVAPCSDLCVLGGHLDDIFLPSNGIGDGVGGAVRQLHMLPLLSDEWPVSKEVFQREVVDVRPGGGAVPGHLQPPGVVTDRGRRDSLRGVWFNYTGLLKRNGGGGFPQGVD